jgi:hypothetical protein
VIPRVVLSSPYYTFVRRLDMDYLLTRFVRSVGAEIFSKYGTVDLKEIDIDRTSMGFEVLYTDNIPEEFVDCLIDFLGTCDNTGTEQERPSKGFNRKWLRISRSRL